jgi:hypothetical protein
VRPRLDYQPLLERPILAAGGHGDHRQSGDAVAGSDSVARVVVCSRFR